MDTEIINGILTFDELLQDEYYSSEIERYVQKRLEDTKNSHSDVKGGNQNMDGQVQISTAGEENKTEVETQSEIKPNMQTPETTEHPDVATTDVRLNREPAREMSAQQFDLYNETLRRVSKTAKGGLHSRYNAFEDAEVKALVKQQVMEGCKPNIKEIAASIVSRLAPKQELMRSDETQAKKDDGEMLSLKAELALLKAGIATERIDAAKKLFIAENGDLSKVAEFVAKYPEWQQAQEGRVVLSKAPPLAGKTAPTSESRLVRNDFERKVAAARKKAGLE